MQLNSVKAKFEAIGARAKFGAYVPRWFDRNRAPLVIDVKEDHKGEFFDIRVRLERNLDFSILDANPTERHLLLAVKSLERNGMPTRRSFDQKYLCGHDERHWFVAATPKGSNVSQAKEALKPRAVLDLQAKLGLNARVLHKRKTPAYVRQGEWFFVPCPSLRVDDIFVLRHEPIRRGRGNAHVVEYLYRRGGTQVHVCHAYPSGLTEREYRSLLLREPDAAELPWRIMVREPEAFAKGKVKHPDHKTILLPFWHRVLLNRELSGEGTVAFLD